MNMNTLMDNFYKSLTLNNKSFNVICGNIFNITCAKYDIITIA